MTATDWTDNRLLGAWRQGAQTIGMWCVIPSSVSAESAASRGFDYVCVDQQHGAVGYDASVPMYQVIAQRAVPLTRVPWNDPGTIMKALDAGAQGVVVPLVSTVEDAKRAVAACRYPPSGIRSYGPVLASLSLGTREPDRLEQVACVVMIETLEGLANVDEIAQVPGIDAVYVGPADLSLVLDLPPSYEHDDPRHAEAISTILAACRRHGVVPGIHCADGDMGARRLEEGFQMVTVCNDLALIGQGSAEALAAAKASAEA